jgi:hypothetical protein
MLASVAAFSASPLAAQILPREKRLAAIERAAKLAVLDDAEFFVLLETLPNPFVEVSVAKDDGGLSRERMIEEFRKDLRITGVVQLRGRKAVFINGRRVAEGDSAQATVGGRAITFKLVAIGPRSISIESDGIVVELPTR